jgi:hypothetical protein
MAALNSSGDPLDPNSSNPEAIPWDIVPFTDPDSGETYDIIDHRAIIALTKYTPLPVVDPNFYQDASSSALSSYTSQCTYPSTFATDPDVIAFLQAENCTMYAEWTEVGGIAVELPAGTSVEYAMAIWPKKYPSLIVQVDPDALFKGCSAPVDDPNDDFYVGSYTMPVAWHIQEGFDYSIRARQAWRNNASVVTASTNKVVAILDTGVDYDPVHLADLSVSSTYYGCNVGDRQLSTTFTSRSSGGGEPWDFLLNRSSYDAKQLGHGTAVAGVLAAGIDNDIHPNLADDGLSTCGLIFTPKYFPIAIKAGGSASGCGVSTTGTLHAYTALGCVIRRYSPASSYGSSVYVPQYNIRVANVSIASYRNTKVLERHIDELSKYILFVASAGNDNSTIKKTWPSEYTSVLSVAAYDSSGDRWFDSINGSNYKKNVTDICAPGSQIITCDMYGSTPSGYYKGFTPMTFYSASGTSVSAPIVAGAAILIDQKFNFASSDLLSRIVSTANHKDIDGITVALSDDIEEFGWLNIERAMR